MIYLLQKFIFQKSEKCIFNNLNSPQQVSVLMVIIGKIFVPKYRETMNKS